MSKQPELTPDQAATLKSLDVMEATARTGLGANDPFKGHNEVILELIGALRRTFPAAVAPDRENDDLKAQMRRHEDASSSPQSALNPRELRQAGEEAAVLEGVRRRGKATGASRDPSDT